MNTYGTANPTRVAEFVDLLRTTDKPQAQGTLARFGDAGNDPKTVGFCCLGLKAYDLGALLVEEYNYETDAPAEPCGIAIDPVTKVVGNVDPLSLAPAAVAEWFGYDLRAVMDVEQMEFDFRVAYPLDDGWDNLGYYVREGHDLVDDGSGVHTLSALNDSGFTFAQIADVVAYFGLGALIVSGA